MERHASTIAYGGLTTDDSCLPAMAGIMAKGSSFTCVEMDSDNNGLKVLCTLNTDNGNTGPVIAIGNGYFGIGRQIFKFGVTDAVCVLGVDIKKTSITRIVRNTDGMDIIVHASMCEPDYSEDESQDEDPQSGIDYDYENGIVIRHFRLDGALIAEMFCEQTNGVMISKMVFWKNHIVVSTYEGPWIAIDILSGKVSRTYQPQAHGYENSSFKLEVIDDGKKMAVFYGNNWEYYDESQECDEVESEPVVRLLAMLDIADDGKLVETGRPSLSEGECTRIVKKAFNISGRYRMGYSVSQFLYMPDFLHLNRSMRGGIRYVNTSVLGYQPTDKDEVLIHVPTRTVLPILGSDKHKDITIHDSKVSANGNYMALLVSAKDGFDTRLQICTLNLRNGKAENATIECFGHYDHHIKAKLHGFVSGNKAIMYSRTNADGIDTLVMQPIFNGVLDCKAADLFRTFDGALPLEIVRHIVNFM